MANLEATILSTLTGDGTLTAILTGGIQNRTSLGRKGLTLDNVPTSGDKIIPNAVLHFPTDTAGLFENERQRFLQIYLYDHVGYTNTAAARARIETLLHRKSLQTDDTRVAYLTYVDGLLQGMAEELGNAARETMRFSILVLKG